MNASRPAAGNERLGAAVIRELAAVLEAEVGLLDWDSVELLVKAIDGARRVLLFGAGRSHSIALAFGQRLTHIGLAAAVVGEAGNQRVTGEDAVVIISGSGRTATAVTIAEQARAAAVGRLCLVTTALKGPIADGADVVVLLHGRAKGGAAGGAAPFTAQFDLCALVLSEVVARLVMERRGIADADIEHWRPNVE